MGEVARRSRMFLLWLVVGAGSFHAHAFVVENIEVEGLKRISIGTVYNYLSIQIGDDLGAGDTADAIRALYKTGFFQDIQIKRNDNTLVVVVAERPSIDRIEFKGNKELTTKLLTKSLAQIGFSKGQTFNRSIFEQVNRELRNAYLIAGRYGVEINSTVAPLERNRVAVIFSIAEGAVAKIRHINIVGNDTYDDNELLDEFEMNTTGWLSWFNKNDRYSKQKLTADTEKLRSFYLDRGFINFNIESAQVSITPDRQNVYITLNITEGKRYRVRDIKLQGDLIVNEEELFERITVVHGEYFSRLHVAETISKVNERLGDEGYGFANVRAEPIIDDDSDQVDVVFYIDPGNRVYIRRINFTGNNRTQDQVLRREMRQLESTWFSTRSIKRSNERLQRLGFFSNVKINTPSVPGTDDQVDIEVHVVESNSGNLSLGASYSAEQGIALKGDISQDNILGTGNRVVASYSSTDTARNIDLSLIDPYWTHSGISRNLIFRWHTTDATASNTSSYDRIQRGGSIKFGIPVTEYKKLDFGADLDHTNIVTGTNVSSEVEALTDKTQGGFTTLKLSSGWSTDTRDSLLLPSMGAYTRLYGNVSVSDIGLSYYKIGLKYQQFSPLPFNFIFTSNSEFEYGNGFGSTKELPLFENFFVGGIRTVRGFKANTLGPRDSLDKALGGNLKLINSAQVIVPLSKKKGLERVRLTAFLDSGNVYGSNEDFDLSELRISAGIAGTWIAPIGPLSMSYAIPLVKKPNDSIQKFQLIIGLSY